MPLCCYQDNTLEVGIISSAHSIVYNFHEKWIYCKKFFSFETPDIEEHNDTKQMYLY